MSSLLYLLCFFGCEQEPTLATLRETGLFIEEIWVSLVPQTVKNLSATRETWVQSLGWEDPLERAWQRTLVVFLLGKSPWREEPNGLQSMRSQRVGHD